MKDEKGKPPELEMSVIEGAEFGDSIGFIDWKEVSAVSWRFSPATTETPSSKGKKNKPLLNSLPDAFTCKNIFDELQSRGHDRLKAVAMIAEMTLARIIVKKDDGFYYKG